ncbi:hypothetical protein [Methylobacterium persicinum]|uniref:C-di-GMP-related signal transduction protein n=1 Tax=Methylobacterium persicinum TaxID=374426 RepID=A0ABU0HJC6_9HYPH|nr:hypothetical protein [Methylobacterium persicinum]MDQ0442429.1 c-di-GMP-related signal transduction protein [Methylobacterium persicinum]GJE37935.1 hypothetical protein KHHGKMAE_1999 [Methylobacterium persicinum]
MLQTREIASEPCFSQRSRSLAEQVAEAVRNRTTPLSQLLKLMSALDAEGGDDGLKRLLRTRIGAPLDA